MKNAVEEIPSLWLYLSVSSLLKKSLSLGSDSILRTLCCVGDCTVCINDLILLFKLILRVIIDIKSILFRDIAECSPIKSYLKLNIFEIIILARNRIFIPNRLLVFKAAASIDPAVSICLHIFLELDHQADLSHNFVGVAYIA